VDAIFASEDRGNALLGVVNFAKSSAWEARCVCDAAVSRAVNPPAAKLPFVVYWEYDFEYNGIMKTTVNIPDSDLEDAIRFTNAKTKREAIVTAIQEFNRRKRMAELTKHAGTCKNLLSVEELLQQRRKG
jgi:Bacterial antitoxin of type II TA system, VapB